MSETESCSLFPEYHFLEPSSFSSHPTPSTSCTAGKYVASWNPEPVHPLGPSPAFSSSMTLYCPQDVDIPSLIRHCVISPSLFHRSPHHWSLSVPWSCSPFFLLSFLHAVPSSWNILSPSPACNTSPLPSSVNISTLGIIAAFPDPSSSLTTPWPLTFAFLFFRFIYCYPQYPAQAWLLLDPQKRNLEFLGDLVVRTHCSHCWEPIFNPWSEN